jgi:hypothetical protein
LLPLLRTAKKKELLPNCPRTAKKKTTLVFSSWETLQNFPSASGLRPPTGWEIVSIVFTVARYPPDVIVVVAVVNVVNVDIMVTGFSRMKRT